MEDVDEAVSLAKETGWLARPEREDCERDGIVQGQGTSDLSVSIAWEEGAAVDVERDPDDDV